MFAATSHGGFLRPCGEWLEERLPLAAELVYALGLERSADSITDLVSLDARGNVYTASRFTGTVQPQGVLGSEFAPPTFLSGGGNDWLITKHDAAGELVWARAFGTATDDAALTGLATDNSGNVYFGGEFSGTLVGDGVALASNGGTDAFLIKLAGDGSASWGFNYGSTGADRATALTVLPSGECYLTGSFSGTVDFKPGDGTLAATSAAGSASAFVLQVGRLGDSRWVKAFGGGAHPVNIEAVEVELNQGHVYLAGTFAGTPDFDPSSGSTTRVSLGLTDVFLARWNFAGEFEFAKSWGNSAADYFVDLKYSEFNNGVVVAANFESNASSPTTTAITFTNSSGVSSSIVPSSGSQRNAYVAEFDWLGDFRHVSRFGGSHFTSAEALAVDPSGFIYLTGRFDGTADFDPNGMVHNFTTRGSMDVFLARFAPLTGELAWATSLGGSATDVANDIAMGVDGDFYLAGTYAGEADLDPSSSPKGLSTTATRAGFLTKMRLESAGSGGALIDSFGTHGRVLVDIPAQIPTWDLASEFARQGDKLIVGGRSTFGATIDDLISVARYNADGTLDTTFGGGDGHVSVALGLGMNFLTGVLVQSNHKIVVLGYTKNYHSGTVTAGVIMRLSADGTPDDSFGSGGRTHVTFTDGVGQAFPGEIQAGILQGDKILVSGRTMAGGGIVFTNRYTENGATDTTFGTEGTWLQSSRNGSQVSSLAFQGSSILLAGAIDYRVFAPGTGTAGFVARLTGSGQLDTTFGSSAGFAYVDGITGWNYPDIASTIAQVIVRSDGGLWVAGTEPTLASSVQEVGFTSLLTPNGGPAPVSNSWQSTWFPGGVRSMVSTPTGDLYAQWNELRYFLDTDPTTGFSFYNSQVTSGLTRLTSSGTIDASFGNQGTLNLAPTEVSGLGIQGDAILTLGGDKGDFLVRRYTNRGVLDLSFNGQGFNLTAMEQRSTGQNWGWTTAFDAKGRVLVAGELHNNNGAGQMFLARFLADGTPDSTFADQGVFYFRSSGAIHSVLPLADDSILIGGQILFSAFLTKITKDGAIDPTFTGFSSTYNYGQAAFAKLKLDSARRIVAVGLVKKDRSATGSEYGMLVARFKSNGAVDNTFSDDSYDIQYNVNYENYASSVFIGSFDRVYVGGTTYSGSSLKHDFAVWQYDATGKLDKWLNNSGKASVDFYRGDDYLSDIAVNSQGEIVIAGYTTFGGSSPNIAMAAIMSRGGLQKSFGNEGRKIDNGGVADNVGAMTLSRDGKILVGAWTPSGYEVTRYLPNGANDASFAPDGRRFIATQNSPAAFGELAIGADGRILLVGTSVFHVLGDDYNYDVEVYELNGRDDAISLTLSNQQVLESTSDGSLVGLLGTTYATPGFSPTFTLLNDGFGHFRIQGDRLEVSAGGGPLDFESGARWQVRVQTVDPVGRTVTAKFNILVEDLNEAPVSVVLTNDTVKEDQPVGTLVGSLIGGDPDKIEQLRYALVTGAGDADNGLFSLTERGELRTAAVFDFETRRTYSLRVRVTDRGGLTFEKALTINVLYVDVTPPTVTGTTPRQGQGLLYEGTTSLQVVFSEPVGGANGPTRFRLTSAGVDGLLGTADDVNLSLGATYASEKSTLTFPALAVGTYRLSVFDAIADPAGHALDGDFDGLAGGDYREDFVVAARGTAALSMLASPQATAGAAPSSAAGGDFNHDGHADLAVINLLSDTYSVFLGDGAGGLTRWGTSVETGASQPFHIVSGYFNDDLNLDLAIAHQTGATIKVFLGDGLGEFLPANPSSGVPSFRTNSLAVGDFDRDGRTDLVALSTAGAAFYFLRGNGAGQFALVGGAVGTGGAGPEQVVAERIDGDDLLDLAIVNRDSNQIALFRGGGDGTFTALGSPFATGGAGPFRLVFGHVDADPYLDLAVSNSLSNNVGILLGNGKGGFISTGTPLAAPGFPAPVELADVDDDAFTDVIVGRLSSGVVQVFRGNGNGQFDASLSLVAGTNPQAFVLGNFAEGSAGPEISVVDYGGATVGVAEVAGMPAVVPLAGAGSVFSVVAAGGGAGQFLSGAQGIFDGANRLRVGGVDYSTPAGQTQYADDGQTLVFPTVALAGVQVSRRITVPVSGDLTFARSLDRFFNPTASPIVVSAQYLGNLGADAAAVLFATSDDDLTPETTDQWIGTDDGLEAGLPAVVHYVHGRGGIAPQSVGVVGDNVEWTYSLTVPPGAAIDLAHFTVVAATRAEALAAAPMLVGPTRLSAVARSYWEGAEDLSLANFVLNFAPTDVTLDDHQIDENSPVGTVVGRLIVTDPDPQNTFDYQLVAGSGADDNAQFTLDASGRLRPTHVFDFEERSSRSVRVRVTDQGGLTFEKVLTVGIVDVVEPPADAEPNDTRASALPLVSGNVAAGRIGNTAAGSGDVDYYRFTLAPNQMARFDGYSGNVSYVDATRLRILDDAGNDLTGYLSYWGTFYRAEGGTYYAELSGPLTTYALNYSVQSLTGVTEAEPNDLPQSAQAVAVAVGSTTTVRGFLGDRTASGDPDVYALTLPANTVLEASVTGVAGFPSSGSAQLSALDAAGNVLGANLAYYLPLRYYAFSGQTIYVRFTERSDLKQAYEIQFRLQLVDPGLLDAEPNDTRADASLLAAGATANAFLGNGAAGAADVDTYRVTLSPRQLASFDGYGIGGHNFANFTDLKLYDDAGHDVSGYLTYWGGFYSEIGGTFYAAVTGPKGPYTFRYSTQTLTGVTEVEPNDSLVTAQAVTVSPGTTAVRRGFLGDRSPAGDPDVYAVFAPAGTVLEVSIGGVPGFVSSGSAQLEALDSSGARLATNPAYYLPLTYYAFYDQIVYVKFTERSDLKQAYEIRFSLNAIDPGILDVEGNDTPSTAISLAPGVTAQGFLGNGVLGTQDVDVYRITLADRELASFDGFGYGGHNYANFTDMKLYGEDGRDLSGYLTYWGGYYSATGGTFYAALTGPRSAYTFRYTTRSITGLTEIEPNDSLVAAQAVPLAVGESSSRTGFWGDRTVDGDPDYYAVYVPAHTRLEVSVQGVSGSPSSGSSRLSAYDGAGDFLGSNPAYYLPLTYFAEVGQTVYVRMSERADLKQAYQINFSLQATGGGVDGPSITPVVDQETNEDESFEVAFSVSDPSSLAGDVQVTVRSSNDTLLPSDTLRLADDGQGNWTLTGAPALDQAGHAVVTVTATDPDGLSTVSRFVVRVAAVDDPPTGIELSGGTVLENLPGAFVGTLSPLDADGAANGTLELLFDPEAMFVIVGSDLRLRPDVAGDHEALAEARVIVQLTDGAGRSCVQEFTIEISDANDAPRGFAATLTIGEDDVAVTTGVLVSDEDPADTADSLTYVISTPPSRGQATANGDGTFTFRPGADFQRLAAGQTETVSFGFQVYDSQRAGGETVTVSVVVGGGEDAPVATSATFDLFAADSFIRLAGVDAESSPAALTYLIDSLPARGALRWNGAAVTVGSSFSGAPDLVWELPFATGTVDESFTFRVRDQAGATSAAATARIKSPTVDGGVVWLGGTSANDALALDVSGGNMRVTRNGVVTHSLPLASVSEVRAFGLGGQDSLQITGLTKNVAFDGGSAVDSLVVNGTAGGDAFAVRAAAVSLGATRFGFTNVESTTLNGNAGADVLTGADVPATWTITDNDRGTWNGDVKFVAIENLTGGEADDVFQIGAAKRLTGLIRGGGGWDVVSYAAFATAVSIDLGSGAATNLGGSAGVEQYVGGAANDTFTVSSRTTPATVRGEGGVDTLVSTLDADYMLSDGWLTRTAIGGSPVTFTLEGVEAATLTGGSRANVFDVSGWTKGASLNGGAGAAIDTVVAEGTGTFTLTDTSLARSGSATITLAAIETATLSGDDRNDVFNVSGWTRNANLLGGGGDDKVIHVGSGAFTLSDTELRRSATSTISLSGIEIASLRGGNGNDSFVVSDRTLPAELDGGGGADALLATGNHDFTLSNAFLVRAGRASIALANLESATLTGGDSNNAFDVSGWNKVATINGGAGIDAIVAANDLDFTLGDTSLARTGYGSVTLTAMETALLTGGAANNTFTVSGWTRSAVIDGQGGADTISSVFDANYVLRDGELIRSVATGTATFVLRDLESALLTGGSSANSFDVSGWTQRATLNGGSGSRIDVVIASGDFNYVLSDSLLQRSGLPPVSMAGVEAATLTGGGGDNSFEVSGWTRNASLNGGGGNDTIVASNAANFTLTDTQLKRGTASTFTLASCEFARLTGGPANDTLNAADFSGQVVLHGGGGNDSLIAGRGAAVLSGGAGNDILRAGQSRSLLIGGLGVDQLVGGAADDLLIDGTTVHDGNAAALDSLLAEWASPNSYQDRIAHLRGVSVGLNGAIRLDGANTARDASVDSLAGNAGRDWYFAALVNPNKDTITGLDLDEFVN